MKHLCCTEREDNPAPSFFGLRISMLEWEASAQIPVFAMAHIHRARPLKGWVDHGVSIRIMDLHIMFTPLRLRDRE